MIDLHTHSSASDGSDSPTALVDLAADRGLTALALTDHDTIEGIAEGGARAAIRDIRFIPGVEIEISWEPGEFHLLGLGIHRPTEEFAEALRELERHRRDRNLGILDRMRELGVEADYQDLMAIAGGPVVGRPHFATLLVERRIVKNREQAFSRYLAKGRPFYAPKGALDFDRALALIKASGGVAILAHPLSLFVSWGRLPGLVAELKERGLDGIEAWHPIARVGACARLEELGRSLGMLVTAGSDFHGSSRAERKLGVTAGGRKIEERYGDGIPL